MPGPAITRSLQNTLIQARDVAVDKRHEYVTLEHILLCLLDDERASAAIDACGGKRQKLRAALEAFLDSEMPTLPDDAPPVPPQQTVGVDRVLLRAELQAITAEMREIDGTHVLIQLLKESESYAVFLLDQQGMTVLKLKRYVSHGIAPGYDAETPGEAGLDEEGDAAPDPLEAYTTPLVAAAADGRIDPLIGRTDELQRMIQVLCRRRKNNPVLVGEPGVGKTAIAEGLALHIHEGRVPDVMAKAEIYMLDMGVLLAGTKFRGQFEERLKGVMGRIAEIPEAILFIDEIHTVVGAGATSGGSMDASNILKPALASGTLRCIGSTTYKDYKASLERDRALERRFQRIDVEEPTVDETCRILEGLQSRYEAHHGLVYDADALTAAATLAAKHIVDRHLPDKAIDVMDEAGAVDRMREESKRTHRVTVDDIELVVSRMARVPPESVSARDRDQLQNLERELRAVIFGQDGAIASLVSAIKLARAGLRAERKPIGSFLFSGPTGVGKTELARQMARVLGVELIRFDMSEYAERHAVSRLIGAPPGYVGFDQGGLLTEKVRKHPYSVLVLDEIEKAHPDLLNILLQVMDHATLTDNNGREADFRNAIVVMTTNAGAHELSTKSIGFSATDVLDVSKAKAAIEKTFAPEFRNRLDAWVRFQGLPPKVILQVVKKELGLLREQVQDKGVTIDVSDEAAEWLAEHGYQAEFGARPLARLIEDRIKKPLADAMLFGKVRDQRTARVRVHDGELTVDVES